MQVFRGRCWRSRSEAGAQLLLDRGQQVEEEGSCFCAHNCFTTLLFYLILFVLLQVFSMPEDCPAFGGTNPNNNDPVVERVRR